MPMSLFDRAEKDMDCVHTVVPVYNQLSYLLDPSFKTYIFSGKDFDLAHNMVFSSIHDWTPHL